MAHERDVGLGLLLDADPAGRVYIEQVLQSSIADVSGQVLKGDEIVEVNGVQMRGKHARDVQAVIASNSSSAVTMRLNRGGRVLDVKLPRSASGMSMSLPASRDASASPSRSRGGGGGGGGGHDLSGIDAQVQHIIRNASDDDTRQLEETLAQSRRRHASRLQEELTRNRTDSADRLQLEIKVLRAEHAGLLEQKLAEIRQQHYQKVEEELESLRSQSAARLEQRVQESRTQSKERLQTQLENLRADCAAKLHEQMVAERQRLTNQLLADRDWLTMA